MGKTRREGGREKGVRVPGLGVGCPCAVSTPRRAGNTGPRMSHESGFGRSGEDWASGLSAGALGDDDLPDPHRSPPAINPVMIPNTRTTTSLTVHGLIFANQQVTSSVVKSRE